MMKHIGKHNNKRIVLLYRQVPNEAHMALVVYSDTLPRMVHDEVMRVLESQVGQNAKELSDVLFRTTMVDGRRCLEALHAEGFIKKVPTAQILITPTAKATVRLDELNTILNEMEQGEAAVKRLQDIDQGVGMSGKRRSDPREVGMPDKPNQNVSRTAGQVEATNSAADLLSGRLNEELLTDAKIAEQRISQAGTLKAQAQQLLAEASRLEAEAAEFTKDDVPTTQVKKNVRKPRVAKTATKAPKQEN